MNNQPYIPIGTCTSFIPSRNKICDNQDVCIHINGSCPKQEYLKTCYPDDERLKTVNQ